MKRGPAVTCRRGVHVEAKAATKPKPTLADFQVMMAAERGQIRRLGRGQAQRAPAQV
jgi:hypothetical protein